MSSETDNTVKKVTEAIEAGRSIRLRAFAVLSETEQLLSFIVENILKKYNAEDYISSTYTAVKELAMNGAKANIKSVLFGESQIDMDNELEYAQGMSVFKENLSEDWVLEYAHKARLQNLYVDIIFDYNSDRMIVEVINNRAISKKEDLRIRQKFQNAMQYDDIAQFYMDGGDSSEGAGMGIVLVTMVLKAQGIDPHLFTIRSNYRDATVAKVEIPLSEDHIPSRQIYEKNAARSA